MTHNASRLGLGTVQFGQAYGISNRTGRVSKENVRVILDLAAAGGVSTLDTAAGYGDAEDVLGTLAYATRPFHIVTKTIGLENGLDAVVARARQSSRLLNRRPIDLLLVHSAHDLLMPDGPALWKALLRLRDDGLYRGIGISAYVDDDPVALARRFRPAAMQVPLSILDQRLVVNGALAALKALGVEVHARSLFLQGLLFLPEDKLPPNLRGAAGSLKKLRARIAQAGTTPLAAALAFALGRPEVDIAVVGVTTQEELEEILSAAKAPAPQVDWASCALDDDLVLTPSRW